MLLGYKLGKSQAWKRLLELSDLSLTKDEYEDGSKGLRTGKTTGYPMTTEGVKARVGIP